MLVLKKGINLGGWFSQCKHTKEWYDTFITNNDIKKIKEIGFDHIRLPIDYNFFETKYGYKRIQKIIQETEKNNLNIILDLHKAKGYDFNNFIQKKKNNLFDDKFLQNEFINLWIQIAKNFNNTNVAFELLNEVVEMDIYDKWNDLIENTIKEIRTVAKNNTILYGGVNYNSTTTVKLLRKPIDKNVLIDIHYYSPHKFTHQRAEWMPDLVNSGEVKYENNIEFHDKTITEAIKAADTLGAKLYCGEFGVIKYAKKEEAFLWFDDFLEVLKKHHLGFAVWTYKDLHFGMNYFNGLQEKIINKFL